MEDFEFMMREREKFLFFARNIPFLENDFSQNKSSNCSLLFSLSKTALIWRILKISLTEHF